LFQNQQLTREILAKNKKRSKKKSPQVTPEAIFSYKASPEQAINQESQAP
jgi:hypothetical protein